MSIPDSAIERRDGFRVDLSAYRADMRTTGRIFADRELFKAIRADETLEQVANVATLPGIVGQALAMPDAHQGYGFPIGGVAATDASPGGSGVISPGGVGFDINCGVRLLATNASFPDVQHRLDELGDALFARVPVGFEKGGRKAKGDNLDRVLIDGARWAVEQGMGEPEDIERCEERGAHPAADADAVSDTAKSRGAGQMGTLGSGNHFVEVQRVDAVLDEAAARTLGLAPDQIVVLIHTGSRGLGHQVCTDAVHVFQRAMKRLDIEVPDRQLACAPVHSPEGEAYLGAMAAAANFAWANRQVITHRVRSALHHVLGDETTARVVYDVAHNMAKLEEHEVDGQKKLLCVHRKGATRAFGPGRPELPDEYRALGQPAFIPGSMGTASYVIVGTGQAMAETWGRVCHGAGRALARTAAKRATTAKEVVDWLKERGIVIRSGSKAGIVEEFPGAYKDVHSVIDVVEGAGLARAVARLVPLAVVKG
jgi:tRNA-splicing ligase RtcB